MKRLLLATALIVPLAIPANADIIAQNPLFVDLGGTGFGVAPRLLTLQSDTLESGGTIAGAGGTTQFFFGGVPTVPQTACTSNGTCGATGGGTRTGANESLVYSVGALGWLQGINVGIGLDTNETGNTTGLTLNSLTLKLYNVAGTEIGSFNFAAAPFDISVALLAFQQGNGNSVFNFGLNAAEEAQYNAILAANGGAFNVFEGLRASFGCGANGPAVCGTTHNFSSSDGAESFLAFNAVPGPIAGAGFIPMLLGGFTMLGLARRRIMARLGQLVG